MVATTEAQLAAAFASLTTDARRHFGSMLDVHRHFGNKHEMLLVTDLSKAEASAGVSARFTRSGKESWSVFAGGREDRNETPIDTLDREIGEEHLEIVERHLHGLIPPELLVALYSSHVLPKEYASLFPFIVGQLSYDHQKLVRVNEVAASSVVVEHDALPAELLGALRYLEANKLAKWVDIQDLLHLFRISNRVSEAKLGNKPVRPQVLTMAMLHQLQKVDHYDEVAGRLLLGWNKTMSETLHRIGDRHHLPVNNGVFDKEGNIYPNLPPEDMAYLGLNKTA